MLGKKNSLLVIGVVLAVIAGIGFWYWQKGKSSLPVSSQSASQAQPGAQPQDQKTVDISLGSQALQKTQNPGKDKLPETNPFQSVYRNPF